MMKTVEIGTIASGVYESILFSRITNLTATIHSTKHIILFFESRYEHIHIRIFRVQCAR